MYIRAMDILAKFGVGLYERTHLKNEIFEKSGGACARGGAYTRGHTVYEIKVTCFAHGSKGDFLSYL